MNFFIKNKLNIFFGLLTLVFVAMAIIGGFKHYSPVPFFDMWDGYLNFFIQSKEDWSVWWSLHNEHRIILPRIFFWIDLAWFGGRSISLIIVNYLLLAASAALFVKIFQQSMVTKASVEVPLSHVPMGEGTGERAVLRGNALEPSLLTPLSASREKGTGSSTSYTLASLFIITWLFSWCQADNLIIGFQCQFILAQFLPLLSFYLLHRSITTKSQHYFLIAILVGILSVGTMANGILTLPLMVIYSLLTRQSWQRILVLLFLSVGSILFYYHGYHHPAQHGLLFHSLFYDTFNFINYLLLYLGGPFYHLVGGATFGLFVAKLAGIVFIFASGYLTYHVLRYTNKNSLDYVLLFFIIYIAMTALGTAAGRLDSGVIQAISHRYTTPALMVWAALFIYYYKQGLIQKYKKWFLLACTLLTIALFNYQRQALQTPNVELIAKQAAALALALNIKDMEQIKKVTPTFTTSNVVAVAAQKHLSIFAFPPLVDIKNLLGTTSNFIASHTCQGNLDTLSHLAEEKKYLRIQGWLYDPQQQLSPKIIQLLNVKNQVIGFAISGIIRQDVAAIIAKPAIKAGFIGYVLGNIENTVMLQGIDSGCNVKLGVPKINV